METETVRESDEKYVMSLDVGTTTIRSMVYNEGGVVVGTAATPVRYYQGEGRNEIDAEALWEDALKVLKQSLWGAGLKAEHISSMGISCQRASFTCWCPLTGKPLFPMITWQDLRADSIVREWNSGLCMRALRAGGRLLHTVTRQPRYLAAAIYKLKNGMVVPRLVWALEHVPGLREAAERGELLFGCIDSWLIYKLSGRHMTEVSNIAASGFFDPFVMQYASWVFSLFHIPMSIMPKVVSSAGSHFGSTKADLLGGSIPITAVLADQSASFFGSGCYTSGSAKITMGTGSFLDVLTASPHASINGLIPLVAWRFGGLGEKKEKKARGQGGEEPKKDTDDDDDIGCNMLLDDDLVLGPETAFLAEGSVHDTGGMVEWAGTLGLFQHVGESSLVASDALDSRGVFFVPGFHGLQGAIGDSTATAGFLGLRLDTTKEEMLRAVLESIAFSQKQLVDAFLDETSYKFDKLVVDGGVAQNDFILQSIADLTGLPVVRPDTVEMSAWGVAALAGIQGGVWKGREEVASLRPKGKEFLREEGRGPIVEAQYKRWGEACKRMLRWNPVGAE